MLDVGSVNCVCVCCLSVKTLVVPGAKGWVGACYLSTATELPGGEGVCVCQSVCASGCECGVCMWETSPHCKLAGVQDRMVERGLLLAQGSSSLATLGTLQTGTWLVARVEFIQITLSKLLIACQDCIPEPKSQMPWPAKRQKPDLRKQPAVGVL